MPSDISPATETPVGLDPSRVDIETRQSTLEEVVARVRDGELDLGRSEPWSDVARSRLIESILIRVPLSTVFIDAGDEGRWVCIDGRRRLSAVCAFMLDKAFALADLEYLTELDGQGYDDLARALKRRLGETQVTLEMVKPGTPAAIRYNLVRRINPRWTPQEARDAVIGGPATRLLTALADGDAYRAATGRDTSTAADRELVLRFLAIFPIAHPPDIGPSLEIFLNRAMEEMNSESLEGMVRRHLLGQRLEAALVSAARLFDGAAFSDHPPDGAAPALLDPAIFETWTVMLARLHPGETERLLSNRDTVIKAFTELRHDRQFAAATAAGSDDPASVRLRFSAIHDLVGQFVSA